MKGNDCPIKTNDAKETFAGRRPLVERIAQDGSSQSQATFGGGGAGAGAGGGG